jgi:hypothetical protein
MSEPVISQALGMSAEVAGGKVRLTVLVHEGQRIVFEISPKLAEAVGAQLQDAAHRTHPRRRAVMNLQQRAASGDILLKPNSTLL